MGSEAGTVRGVAGVENNLRTKAITMRTVGEKK